jgi:tRNA A-37 threonylcarbamoyl transferase component Bud32
VDLDAKNVGELLEELENEVNAYEKLRPLWGESVPTVYRYGKCDETHCCILAQEFLPGRQLEVSKESEKVKIDTLRTLVQIHGLGVVHGDIRLSNIMLVDEKLPFFIHFGFAMFDGTKEHQEREQADLRRILGL